MAYTASTIGGLDTALPNGAVETQAALDDAQRETRAAWVNTMGVEHTLAGAHDFPRGATGDEPLLPTTGQWFFNTTLAQWQRYSGTAWVPLKLFQPQTLVLTGMTYAAFQVHSPLCPLSRDTVSQPIVRTRVWFEAGVYAMRGSAYIERLAALSNAGSYIDISITGSSGGPIVIVAGGNSDGLQNVDSASPVTITIPTSGWYSVNVNAYMATTGRAVALRACSLHWELA